MKNNTRLEQLTKRTHSTTLRFFIRSLMVNCLLVLMPLLLISLYSIARTTKESTRAAKRQAAQILTQADNIIESLYTHVDNAYLFFSSNPRVRLQLKNAFREKALSLNSIKSVENISLNFQNLIYTDEYLQSIYVYYQNDYHRIFAPLHAKLMAFSPEQEQKLLTSYSDTKDEDVWMAFSNEPLLYTEYPSFNLLIYRKLFRRTTDIQEGLIVFSFHADRLASRLRDILEYDEQLLFLIDPKNQVVWPSSDVFPEETILSLAKQSQDSNQAPLLTSVLGKGYAGYEVTCLPAPRSYGFSYLLLTPKSRIYQTTISLISMYLIITLASIAIACLLAFFKTRHDYKYLNQIISVFSTPATAIHKLTPSRKRSSSPFEFILTNIIRLFLEQDYLKMQDSEKAAKLQLAKMQALQHQINPHFLHNTLNNIYWESVKLTGSENRCSQMISYLSTMMRYSLSDPQEQVSIKHELDYLKKYLEIMKLRHADKFEVRIRLQPRCSNYSIKKMLLQPLVENAIYHGIKEKKEKGLIQISVHQKRNRVCFCLYDTGNGIPEEKLLAIRSRLNEKNQEGSEHIGLANTNSRLILSYGQDSALHIHSVYTNFTVIWFSVPVSEDSVGGYF